MTKAFKYSSYSGTDYYAWHIPVQFRDFALSQVIFEKSGNAILITKKEAVYG